MEIVQPGGGSGAALTVTDGVTPVVNVTTIDFTSGAVVTNGGGGVAEVAIVGGGGYLTPTGTVDASNTVFGVSAEPQSVVSDGIVYFDGSGYTYAALQITMDIPPSQYIRYTV